VVPSEHSNGASIKRGGLTKTGNSTLRRLLIEPAWCYRFPARVSRKLLLRQEEQPKPIREIARGTVRGWGWLLVGFGAPVAARHRRAAGGCLLLFGERRSP
jgi:transposase